MEGTVVVGHKVVYVIDVLGKIVYINVAEVLGDFVGAVEESSSVLDETNGQNSDFLLDQGEVGEFVHVFVLVDDEEVSDVLLHFHDFFVVVDDDGADEDDHVDFLGVHVLHVLEVVVHQVDVVFLEQTGDVLPKQVPEFDCEYFIVLDVAVAGQQILPKIDFHLDYRTQNLGQTVPQFFGVNQLLYRERVVVLLLQSVDVLVLKLHQKLVLNVQDLLLKVYRDLVNQALLNCACRSGKTRSAL